MKFSGLLIVTLSLLLIIPEFGNSQDIKFDHLTMEDGLSSNLVRCIFQDSRGFIWFGTTNGLNRYDGYNFIIIRSDPKDILSLYSSDINDICEDNKENLWVATSKGLNKICLESGKITRINSGPADFFSLRENKINVMYFDQKDNLWIGTRKGLSRLTFHQKPKIANQFEIQHFWSETTKSNTHANNIIQAICEDKKGNLWIGIQEGLHKYNPVQEIFTVYRHDPLDNHSISHNDVRSVFEDSEGMIWIGTWGGWLNRLDPTSGRFTHYSDNRLTHITTIAEDLRGNLWFGARAKKGLSCLVKNENEFRFFTHDPADKNSLNGHYISDIFVDNSGILWIASVFGDLNIYDPHKRKFEHYYHIPSDASSLNGNCIWSICEDKSGKVWLAFQQKGVDCFDPVTGNFMHYEHTPGDPNSLNSNLVHPIYEDNSGLLWVGTSRGLARFNPEINKFTRYTGKPEKHLYPKSLTSNNILSIWEDEEECLWIGTLSGLNCLNRRTGQLSHYFINPLEKNNAFDNMVIIVYKDMRGVFWINTYHGLYTFDKSNKKFTRYIIHPENNSKIWVNCIAEDQHNFWFGTEVGLIKIDKASGRRFQYTKQDGLPDNDVVGLLFDDNGLLWLSTLSGLCRFNPVTETFRNYSLGDGLQSLDYNAGAFHKGRNGYFYFGGCNGFNRFHPDSVRDNQFIPPVHISYFQLLKQDLQSTKPYDLSKTIELTYYQHDFVFEFVALNYTNSSENQYAYRLLGFDEDWLYSGNRRTATYTNLDPGTYTFEVIGSNNDGKWNEEPASLNIIILPPWWRTTWAYISYFMLFVLTLYALRKYDLKRQRLKQELEMEHFEADKLREVDHLKSRFFANISHEFRTPLTLIEGPIKQILQGEFQGNIKEAYNLILKNTRRLLDLVNQLLDLSKLEARKLKIQATKQNVLPLLSGLVQSFESLARKKDIDFVFKTPERESELYIDQEKFEKIIINLLSNAFKFTPERGKIEVKVTIQNQAGKRIPIGRESKSQFPIKSQNHNFNSTDDISDFAEIRITNTGSFLTRDQIEHIFDRFYQVNESSGEYMEGSGIGLALVKELVELHHGRINVQSDHNIGTSFILRLPLGRDHLRPEEIIETSDMTVEHYPRLDQPIDVAKEKPGSSVPKNIGNQQILIVEDNKDVRLYVIQLISDEYSLLEAENGEQALKIARRKNPDLIITDVMMPEMDGMEFCRLLKEDLEISHIPVIMLTARADLEDKLQGLELGADDYISKPFEARELRSRIRNVLGQRERIRKSFSREYAFKTQELTITPADKKFFGKLLTSIEHEMHRPEFNVDEIADLLHVSRATLNRKIQTLTDLSPAALIKVLRLKKARQLLRRGFGNVSQVAFEVGFNSASHFSRSFVQQFGHNPSEETKSKTL